MNLLITKWPYSLNPTPVHPQTKKHTHSQQTNNNRQIINFTTYPTKRASIILLISTMSAHQHYRKILLSKRELAHVYRNIFYASQDKINQIVPGSTPYDDFVIRIQNIISEDLETTFDMARHALIVDGSDLANENVPINELLSVQETEEVVPFDAELNQELRDLIEMVEIETTEVTQLRRELPQQARDVYEHLVRATDQQVTEIIKECSENNKNLELSKTDLGLDDDTNFSKVLLIANGHSPILQKDTVRAKFEKAIENIYQVKQEFPLLQSHFDNLDKTTELLLSIQRKQRAETPQ